ncbi:hypothetical protein N7495_008858 [Penicillium taxi]|uniref:uncharacterized protein n=1 Tax=Penicillium taxi TaxID=168475 RepID=UPI00254560A1|nr:uncharacterized protein N7495_008858 [Penicillium taxi]KAJ5888817.1 hypothetical protein N7495_008858 [Penicillium taxi]
MALDTQPKVCLDVAVDHRIRRLFKPVSDDLTEPSNHVSRLERRGWALKRKNDEIQVTTQLASPAVKGGIAVVLKQPRDNHPFEKGLNAVIQDCNTLSALDDIFSAVSCKSLNIRTDITIVDLLPYIYDYVEKMEERQLKDSLSESMQIIINKEPSVLLCAGKIWLPNLDKSDDWKRDARKLQSIGVGKRFDSTSKLPVVTRIHRADGELVAFNRLNGFHPSHAINYHPQLSILRQLQILIGAETCGMLRGDCEEEEWMSELRESCQKVGPESPSRSPGPQSPRERSIKYLPYYQELYSDKLDKIHKCAQLLISQPMLAMVSSTALYKPLLTSGLSQICNDATLILRQMFCLKCKGWPEHAAQENKDALRRTRIDTFTFTDDLFKITEPGEDTQFAKIIREGGWDAFLKIAINIETLLMDLLVEDEKALYAMGQEELLLSKMERMKLASAIN